MNLFKKTLYTSKNAETPNTQATEPSTPNHENTATAAMPTAEEAARQWWQERYGETMPEEMTRWLKQLTRTEARRINIAQTMLTPQQLSRIEDARRLAETKLHNIEASLQRLHDQQDWIRRFNETKHELNEHRNRLYEVNKRLATVANDEKALERFEAFESIQGLFQRMLVMEKQSKQNKQEQSLLARNMEELRQTTTDGQKRLQQLEDNRRDATKQMGNVRDRLEEANRILGARTILELDKRRTDEWMETIGQQKLILHKEMEEMEMVLNELQEAITRQKKERQTMEPHQELLEHADMVQTLLEQLYEMRQELDLINRKQEEDLRHQQEENDMLNRAFSNYQRVEADIKMLNEELQLHRQQNLGRTSYSLQERAMQLKGRRQMLISAQSLWNRIQAGYARIEEKSQTVNRLRLSIENLQRNLEQIEATVAPMRQLCHEKEYTLTLSKSQNVIQLRGDLKEGVSCTVCGATHHPYHSETMLDQSKLISEMRTDFELLQAELASKERQLRQLEKELTAETARHEVEEETLSRLRQRQMEDVKEWATYASLDRSFGDCSSATNPEARTAMLRQLIENAEHDADAAIRDLDEYNFHQTRINEIAEELTRKEQKKNDLTLRLNEVNTGCQVLARQVEHYRQLKTNRHEHYTHLYEKLEKMITLADWYRDWENNHEGLTMRISKMVENWQHVNNDIELMLQQQEKLKAILEEKQNASAFLDNLLMLLRDFQEKRNTLYKEGQKTYETLLGELDVKEYFEQNYQTLQRAEEEERQQRTQQQGNREQLAEMSGRQQALLHQCQELDAQAIAERSQLDVWMRQFNANNPPVQYVELEQAFDIEKDWNVTRNTVRSIRIEAILEQTRVDALRSAVVALQAEGMRPSTDNTDEALASIVAQQQQLEKQRQEVLMQLAEHHIALNKHEQCKARLKAEEEELYAIADKR